MDFVEVRGDHGVAWDVVRELVGVVRWSEACSNESSPRTLHDTALGKFSRISKELVDHLSTSTLIFHILDHLLEGLKDSFERPHKVHVHKVVDTVLLVVLTRQPEEGSQRVDLELPLPNLGSQELSLVLQVDSDAIEVPEGVVIQIEGSVGLVVIIHKGVGIGVHHYQLGLHVEEPLHKGLDLCALLSEAKVGDHLVGGVPEPHSWYVTCDDVAEGFIRLVVVDGGVECVGEGVLEDREEFR